MKKRELAGASVNRSAKNLVELIEFASI